jgi:prevent-host-death family protein
MSTATLDISEARTELARLPDRLREEQVIWVTKHSKRAFAVVDLELMDALLETLEILRDPELFKMFQESLEDIQAGRLIDHEDIVNQLNSEDRRENPRIDPMDGNSREAAPGNPKKRR